jgi:PAS domain S-box-containing protein
MSVDSEHETLRVDRSLLAAIVKSSDDAIVSKTLDGIITSWNPAAERLFGYIAQEAIGRPITIIFPPDRLHEEKIFLARIGVGETIHHYEATRVRKDGSTVDVSVTLSPILDRNGHVVGASKIARDISERRQLEETLRKNEQRLQGFYNSGLVGLLYWDMDGRIVDANDKFLEMVGYDRGDLAASRIDWQQMTPPEFAYLDERSVVELKATGVNSVPFEKEYVRKDGSRIPVLVAGAMLDEARSHGVAFVIDITERKQAEAKLAASEARYRDLVEWVPAMLWTANVEGVTTGHSGRWLDYTGQTSEQALGDGWKDVVHPDDVARVGEHWGKSVRTGQHYRIEYRIRRASDGAYRWQLVEATLRRDERNRPLGWFGSCIDIEDRKQAEEALLREKTESEFRVLAEAMPQIVWVTRADGWNIFFNKKWVEYTGLTLEESYGHGWNKPFHPDDQQRAWDAWQNAVNRNGTYSVACEKPVSGLLTGFA